MRKFSFFIFVLCLIGSFAVPQSASALIKKPESTQVEHVQPSNYGVLWQVRREMIRWQAYINRQIPKQLREVKREKSASIVLFSAFMAFVYGIVHTLGPGHGKMVVATYLLTRKTSYKRGFLVGLQVAFAHVAGAVLIVFATKIALSSFITDPEKELYWVRFISYSALMLIGAYLFVAALRRFIKKRKKVGCLQCAAIERKFSGYQPLQAIPLAPTNKQNDFNKQDSTFSLFLGLVPCTGSLLILLYAMAHDMLAIGFMMVLFVALGMAVAMTAIGLLSVKGHKLIVNKLGASKPMLGALMEMCGALVIMALASLLFAALMS